VGVRNSKDRGVMDSRNSLESVSMPVIDIFGDGGDGKDYKHASKREYLVSDTYEQVFVNGADHLFNGDEDKMVDIVVEWLKKQDA